MVMISENDKWIWKKLSIPIQNIFYMHILAYKWEHGAQ